MSGVAESIVFETNTFRYALISSEAQEPVLAYSPCW